MNNPKFGNGEIYHIYNRGTDKRTIFMDRQDHKRFLYCLNEFNDINPTLNANRTYNNTLIEVQPRSVPVEKERIVEILAFCMMPNHYHLLLRQLCADGITLFMRKLGTGYTMYFNQKNKRSGALFQGRYKAIHVDNETYFRHLPHYIHLNPLELSARSWKEDGESVSKALEILEKYPWGSFHDYTGKDRYSSLLNTDFIEQVFGNPTGYINSLEEWIEARNSNELAEISIDSLD